MDLISVFKNRRGVADRTYIDDIRQGVKQREIQILNFDRNDNIIRMDVDSQDSSFV